MSKKLGIVGNFLTVIDSVTGERDFGNPSVTTVWAPRVDGIALKQTTEKSIGGSQYFAFADITDINGDAFADDAAIMDWLDANCGTVNVTVDRNKPTVLVTDNKVLVVGDADYRQIIAVDAKTFTLPEITQVMVDAGKTFLFHNNGADGAVALTLSPDAIDAVHGTIANAAADKVAGGVLNKDWVNTKSTANKGDWCALTPLALTEWHVTGGVGIWASEA